MIRPQEEQTDNGEHFWCWMGCSLRWTKYFLVFYFQFWSSKCWTIWRGLGVNFRTAKVQEKKVGKNTKLKWIKVFQIKTTIPDQEFILRWTNLSQEEFLKSSPASTGSTLTRTHTKQVAYLPLEESRSTNSRRLGPWGWKGSIVELRLPSWEGFRLLNTFSPYMTGWSSP